MFFFLPGFPFPNRIARTENIIIVIGFGDNSKLYTLEMWMALNAQKTIFSCCDSVWHAYLFVLLFFFFFREEISSIHFPFIFYLAMSLLGEKLRMNSNMNNCCCGNVERNENIMFAIPEIQKFILTSSFSLQRNFIRYGSILNGFPAERIEKKISNIVSKLFCTFLSLVKCQENEFSVFCFFGLI